MTVNRVSDYGLYLADEEQNEVLLPNRFVSLSMKVGDPIEVFVYHDSEDRLVASTEKPYATVGEVAFLRVVDKTIHGAFLDWGLAAKDLFLPNRNMKMALSPDRKYIVYIYSDDVTGRAVATTKISGFISNEDITVVPREEVHIIVVQKSEMGYRVVINNKHWGMLYANQLFQRVEIGDKLTAYVRKITPDNRIDVSLQQEGYDEIKRSVDKLLELIRANGGTLPIGDNSAPDEITRLTQMSKKVFKRTAGYLLKKGGVELGAEEIKLKK